MRPTTSPTRTPPAITAPAAARLRAREALVALLALPILILTLEAAGIVPGLILLLGGVGMAALLVKPEWATTAVAFILYTNLPAIAHQEHGVPQLVAGAFILLLGIPLARFLVLQHGAPRFDTGFALILAFLGVMIVSAMRAVDGAVALEKILTYVLEGVLLYWLVINAVRSLSILRSVLWTVLAAGVLLGGLSIYQSATGSFDRDFGGLAHRKLMYEEKREADERAGEGEGKLYSALRAQGPGLGHNRYAQTMIVLLPLALFGFRRARSLRARAAVAAAGGVILVGGVVLTYSRGAMVSLALLLLLATAVGWVRRSHLVIGGIAVVALVPILSPVVYNRVATLGAVTSLDDPSEADGALRGRATEMLAAYHAFRDHPVLGVGPGQYHQVYSVQYQQIPEIKFRDIRTTRRAHSLYFEMAADTGVVGLIVFLAIPLVLLRGLWVQRRFWTGRSAELADLAAAFTLGIVGFLATALFLSHAYERYYWFLLALSGSALWLLREQQTRRVEWEEGRRGAAAVKEVWLP